MEKNQLTSAIINKFNYKIGITFLGLLLIIIFFLLFFSSYFFDKLLVENEDRLIKTIANVLTTSLKRVSFSGRFHTQLFLDQLLQNESDLIAVFIVNIIDNKNQILAKSIDDDYKLDENFNLSSLLHDKNTINSKDFKFISSYKTSLNGKRYKEVILPFNLSFDRSLEGYIILDLSTSVLEEQLSQHNLLMFGVGLLTAIISALLVFLITKKIGKPINKLALTFRGILNYAPMMIWLYDEKGNLLEVSSSFFESALNTHNTNKNFDLSGKLPDLNQILLAEEIEQFPLLKYKPSDKETTSILHNNIILKRNGNSSYYTAIHFPIQSLDNKYCFCTMAIDINKEIAMKEALERQNQEVQKAAEAKTLFLATMSHEIRTPLTAITGFMGLLSESKLEDIQQKYLKIAQSSSENLIALVNDVLDYTKIENNSLDLESIDFSLNELLFSVENIFSFQIQERGLIFKIYNPYQAENKHFIGDPMRISQVLINLISNAIKFTLQGEISLHVIINKKTSNEHEKITFKVCDCGIGIAEDKLATIFETFHQGDCSIARKFGGTGLGLAISKRLAELMGGSLDVESKVNSGSTFYFTISLLQNYEKNKPMPVTGLPLATNSICKSLLVVDDDESNRLLVGIFLSNMNVEVDFAISGEEALEKISLKFYDVILMDIQMPGMDGVETLAEIRKFEQEHGRKPVPTYAFTANVFQEHIQAYTMAGFDGHLSKPIKKSDLVVFINKIIT